MKERAVTMDADAVRATLAGLKTQMRVPVEGAPAGVVEVVPSLLINDGDLWDFRRHLDNPVAIRSPLKVGDRMWVRETWSHDAPDIDACRAAHEDASGGIGYGPYYLATEVAPQTLRWTSPVRMPRWASRLMLEVAEVRLQRLQAIAEEDAIAEGVRHWPDIPDPHPYGQGGRWAYRTPTSTGQCFHVARFAFGNEWNRRYAGANWSLKSGPSPWDRNDWVFAYTYRRVS